MLLSADYWIGTGIYFLAAFTASELLLMLYGTFSGHKPDRHSAVKASLVAGIAAALIWTALCSGRSVETQLY